MKTITERGFALLNFTDLYGKKCSLQESSLATTDAIWFGVDDAEPKIMSSIGWVDYEIPKDVLLHTRMHLSRDQVAELIPTLINFVKYGQLWDGD